MKARRRLLALMGSTGSVALLSACAGGGSSDTTSTPTPSATSTPTPTPTPTPTSTPTGSCVAHPTETNGPYPADGSNRANGAVANVLIDSGIVRSDIRDSFGSASGTAAGVEMRLKISLQNVNNNCAPLEGYAIYVWHCTATGTYSVYEVADQNYLRGVLETDANGEVEFTTIFPGCYSGRYPHIHFEVYSSLSTATHYNNRLLVSQMALPASECSYVYNIASGTYGNSGANFTRTSVSSDNVFGDNSSEQIEAQTIVLTGDTTDGYDGTVTVGLSV
ncbi:MAG: intradiol ring-cleavage dioxygenase [Ponticaulis sp.]|nr:intradiol ring-cleavage dioxygenase [Ponticaulis sp.]